MIKRWYTTQDFSHLAKRHCAVTLAMNVSELYAINQGYEGITWFKLIHRHIKNGPVLFLKRKLRQAPFNLKVKRVKNDEDIKRSLDQQNVVALLQRRSLFNWHWVLAIDYTDDELIIVDNWHTRPQKFNPKGNIKLCYLFSFVINKEA